MDIPHDLEARAFNPESRTVLFTSREVAPGEILPLPHNIGLVCHPDTFPLINEEILLHGTKFTLEPSKPCDITFE